MSACYHGIFSARSWFYFKNLILLTFVQHAHFLILSDYAVGAISQGHNEPGREIVVLITLPSSEGSGKPARLRRLTRTLTSRKHIVLR